VPDDLRFVADCFARLGYTRVLAEVSDDPTADAFRNAVRDWLTEPARTPRDQVVFYYSGHGETRDRHYLCFSDTRERLDPQTGALQLLTGTAIATEDLIRPLILDSPIQQAIVVIDTCHAGRGIGELIQVAAELEQHAQWDYGIPHGLSLVAATRAREFAAQGAFARAFSEAILNPIQKEGGLTQPHLFPGDVLDSVAHTVATDHPPLCLPLVRPTGSRNQGVRGRVR
jgi:hypothetical protein